MNSDSNRTQYYLVFAEDLLSYLGLTKYKYKRGLKQTTISKSLCRVAAFTKWNKPSSIQLYAYSQFYSQSPRVLHYQNKSMFVLQKVWWRHQNPIIHVPPMILRMLLSSFQSNFNLLGVNILNFLRLYSGSVSLVAQMVKRLPAMWDTSVWSLDQEDPPVGEMATHSSILAWKIPWMAEPGRLYSPWGRKESDTTERLHLSPSTF